MGSSGARPQASCVARTAVFAPQSSSVRLPRSRRPLRSCRRRAPSPPARPSVRFRSTITRGYSAKFNAFKPRPVRLENQFGRATARVLRPIRICAPAEKNAEPIRNRIAHLACYSLTGVQGPEQQSLTVTVTNQFGVLPAKVLVVPPESLCLPASKRLGTLSPRRAVPTNLDHYACYSIDPSRPFQRRNAKVRDQFGSFTDAILAPKTLCVPTRKNGSKLVHPRVHLVCVPSLKRLTLA